MNFSTVSISMTCGLFSPKIEHIDHRRLSSFAVYLKCIIKVTMCRKFNNDTKYHLIP